MEKVFVLVFFSIVCFMFGYFVGYNKGFKECEEIKEKFNQKLK